MGKRGYGRAHGSRKGQNIKAQATVTALRRTVKFLEDKVKEAKEINERLRNGSS